jgi:hypothetical protein
VQPLTAEAEYCYRISAQKTAYCNGGWSTDFSTPAVCTTTFSKRPETLTAKAINAFKVQLNWKDVSGDEDRFEIETLLWNGQWVSRAFVDKKTGINNDLSFIDTIGIQPLTKYVYRVRAIRGSDKSPPSNEAVVYYEDPKNNGIRVYTTPPYDRGNCSTCTP